ncbi:MAG: YfhO family protein [Candidatus Abyssubacteria bacterium]|nr:YfhO family protein [Candidatus Abyssubacteria bacterium]
MKGFFSREDKSSILAIALLLVLFCHRLLFTSLDRILAAFDMGHMQYFWAYFKKECYLNGILPLWCPYIFGGHPHAAMPDAAVFYPPDVMYLILPLGFAMNLSIVLHLFMAGIFTYLYCREIKLSPNASLVGAIVFMLHGFFANQLTLGHIDIVRTACYLPAVFYFVERGLIRKDWKSYLWGSLALALQILCGHPQMYFYTILFLGLYAILRAALLGSFRKERWKALSPLLIVFFITGVAVCLTVFQLSLTFEYSRLSDRMSHSMDFATLGSALPLFPRQLVSPDLTINHSSPEYETGGYAGIIPLAAALFALMGCRKKSGYVPLMGLMGAASLLLMFGGRIPMLHPLFRVIPGIMFFRIHGRSVLILAFCISVLSAIGIQELFSGGYRRKSPRVFRAVMGILALALVALGAMLVFWPGRLGQTHLQSWNILNPVEEPLRWSDAPALLPLLWLSVGMSALYVLDRFGRSRKIQLMIIGIVWLDLFSTLGGRLNTIPLGELVSQRQFLREAQEAQGVFRVWYPTEPYPSNRAIADHIENMNGYAPLMLGRYMNFLASVTGIQPAWKIKTMNHLGLELFSTLPSAVSRLFNTRFGVSFDPATQTFRTVESRHWTPRAYLVSNYQLVETEADSLSIVSEKGFDPLELVVLEKPPAIPPGPADSGSRVLSTRTAINEIEVSYRAMTPKILVLSEQYYPGWRATVDGAPTKIYRANYLLRAVEAPAGTHTVCFSYRPSSLAIGFPISILTLLGIVVVLVKPVRRKSGRGCSRGALGNENSGS